VVDVKRPINKSIIELQQYAENNRAGLNKSKIHTNE